MDPKDSSSGSPKSPTAPSASNQKPKGQKSSSERGAHTNHKKNPGKRPHQGGGSR